MKIAVFYPSGCTAWSVAKGVSVVLSRMGHTVLDDDGLISFERLPEQDAIFVAGPEYLWRPLRSVYPHWDSLKVPKIGWLHETVQRDDYGTNPIAINGMLPLEELKKFAPLLYTQASQDQKYDMPFVQCGVDTKMFNPGQFTGLKNRELHMYSGSLYQKRKDFLAKYPLVREYFEYKEFSSPRDYAEGLRDAFSVFNFPSLSAMSTARVFEVLASRTLLVTPRMEGPENYTMFEHGKHLFYYEGDPLSAIKDSRKPENACVAHDGYEEVMKNHKLEKRLETMLKGR